MDDTTQATATNTDPNTKPTVVIYSTVWCGYCKMLKGYLESKGVAYTEKDIEVDEEAYRELMQKINNNYVGVPVTDINGEMILGFDRTKIDEALHFTAAP